MRLLIAVGCVVGAAVALLGGAIVPLWILFVPWTAYLSLMPAAYLFWPWDLLLQEAGFVTLFLDSTCPHPFVAFSLRCLPPRPCGVGLAAFGWVVLCACHSSALFKLLRSLSPGGLVLQMAALPAACWLWQTQVYGFRRLTQGLAVRHRVSHLATHSVAHRILLAEVCVCW